MAFTIFLGILGALLLISAIGKIASKGTPGKRTLGIILGFTAVACFTLAKTNYDECHALSASSASLPIPEEEMLSQLKKAPTIETCQDFINTYPESRHRKDVLNIYESLAAERSLKELNMFVETYHIGWTRLQSKCDSLYSIAAKENTVDSWQKYYDTVPSGYKADAQEKIEELKHHEGWETEPIAWRNAVRTGNYEKYLDLYPNGRHRNEAKTRRDVNEAFTTTHFDLDKWLKSDDNDGFNSKIIITNRAECGITVKFSGPSTKKVKIPANQTTTTTIKNGAYRIVAEADKEFVIPYTLEQSFDGIYPVILYIKWIHTTTWQHSRTHN